MKQPFVKRMLLVILCACLATTLFAATVPAKPTSAAAASCPYGTNKSFALGFTMFVATPPEQVYTCLTDALIELTFQSDGNFVLYINGVAQWSSRTAGYFAGYASFQKDGNLVVYQLIASLGQYSPVWASGTANQGATEMRLQSDGNLVIYRNSTPLWSTNTAGYL